MRLNRRIPLVVLSTLPFCLPASGVSALTITPYDPATSLSTLTSALLAGTSGITITSSNFVGISGQSGTYSGLNLSSTTPGQATVSAPNGVLLTNGTASIPLTNTSAHFGAVTGSGSNAALSALSASAGGTSITNDQNVLTLSFTVNDPTRNAISVKLVYGSDEYPETAVTDIFGFFVDGKNYAAFPDGSLISFKGTTAGFFNNNTAGGYGIEYDGISNLLTINGLLDPNLTVHTLTLAIADTADSIYDSGAFLSALQSTFATGGGIVPPTAIGTTGGDIAPNVFSLGSTAAQAAAVDFEGGTLRITGGTFVNNIITNPVTLGAASGTVDTSTGNGGFSGTVSGPGSLTIEGGGTFSLTGNNSYVGGTLVKASTLAIGNSAALGTGTLTLADATLRAAVSGLSVGNAAVLTGGSTIDTQSFTFNYAGPISGNGSLTKGGTGTLLFGNLNTYSGPTTVADGTLKAGSTTGFSPNSAFTVAGGATLDLGGFNATLGSLAGAGRITNSGVGKVGLTTGGNNESTLVTGTLDDGIGGLSLTKVGSGLLLLSGASTYSGGTFLDAGAIALGNDAALGTGALNMAPGTTLAFVRDIKLANSIVFTAAEDPTIDTGANFVTLAGPISGFGDLTKVGTGTLDLTGISSYTGATTVAGGTLLVDGSIAPSFVTVASGARLGGAGTIGGFNLLAGATLAPGARTPFSTLTVAGNAVFQPGSLYSISINGAGQSDSLSIGGVATINGGTLAISVAGVKPNTAYNILTASGGLIGRFDAVVSNATFAFLAPTIGYSASGATFTFTQTAAFNSIATTPNQRAAAAAIQSLGPGNAIFGAVIGLDPASARRAFAATAGEAHGSAVTTAFTATRVVNGIIFDRLWNLPVPRAGDALDALQQFEPHNLPALLNCYAPVTPAATGVRPGSTFAVWGQAIGDFGRSGGDGNAGAVDRTLGGFVLGADTRLDAKGLDNWRVGVAGGYTNSSFATVGGGGGGTFENIFGTLYAGARYGQVDVRLGATYGGTATNVRRTVAFPGFNETERSSNGGETVQGFGEIGYRFTTSSVVIEPLLNGSITHTHQDGYREKGGAAALIGAAQDVDVGSTVLGFRSEFLPFGKLPIVARLFLGWQHTYGDINPASSVAFASGSAFFNSYGAPLDRNAIVAETGLDWRVTPALSVGLTYFGQVGARDHDNAVKGRVEYRF